jgi:hypothetical protein
MSNYLKSINALYAENYPRRTKVCTHCKCEFCDITKRNLKNCCSTECTRSLMVSTRKSNGSYVQTEESKEKKRISVKNTYASREVFSQELRKKFSETLKNTWKSGKMDMKNHSSRNPEARKKMSESLKGFKHSLETRKNMSLAAQARLRNKREFLYTSAKGGFREDLGFYFRSAWEANFARILNLENKVWEYEKTTFQLTETMSYTPDFYCEGVIFNVWRHISWSRKVCCNITAHGRFNFARLS